MLIGGLVVAGTAATAPLLSSCDRGPSAEQLLAAKLQPLALAARADADAARALISSQPSYGAALREVATERDVHARALNEEITRLDPAVGTSSSTSASASAAPSATPGTSPGSIDDLRRRLNRSAKTAANTSIELDGYRAGLLASVSASTTTLQKVQLA